MSLCTWLLPVFLVTWQRLTNPLLDHFLSCAHDSRLASPFSASFEWGQLWATAHALQGEEAAAAFSFPTARQDWVFLYVLPFDARCGTLHSHTVGSWAWLGNETLLCMF